jgi:hypothetical protein
MLLMFVLFVLVLVVDFAFVVERKDFLNCLEDGAGNVCDMMALAMKIMSFLPNNVMKFKFLSKKIILKQEKFNFLSLKILSLIGQVCLKI